MNKDKKAKKPQRNRAFAAAFDHLKRTKVVADREDLAKLIGRTKETVARILRGETDVTDDVITKLQTATDCIFNFDFLWGDSTVMLAADVAAQQSSLSDVIPLQSLVSAKDEMIAVLRSQLEDKDRLIADKERYILTLEQQLRDLRTGNRTQ